jgi:hypothetical protein
VRALVRPTPDPNDHHHPAVLRTAFAGLVGSHRRVRAIGDGRHPVQGHALLVHEAPNGLGPLLAKTHIQFFRAGGVGVALDLDIDIAIVGLQLLHEVHQPGLGLGRQVRALDRELDGIVRQHHRIEELALGQLAGRLGALQGVAGGLVELTQPRVLVLLPILEVAHLALNHGHVLIDVILCRAPAQGKAAQGHRARDCPHHHLFLVSGRAPGAEALAAADRRGHQR